jgi:Tol biopolymer transport system component
MVGSRCGAWRVYRHKPRAGPGHPPARLARDRAGCHPRSLAPRLTEERGGGQDTLGHQLDWRGFVPTGSPTRDGRAIGGLVSVEPAVRDLVTGDITILQKQQHEDDSAGPVIIAPDGAWAAYSWYSSERGHEHVEIRKAPVAGGDSRLVTADDRMADARVAAWTPDGRALLALLRGADESRTLAMIDTTSGAVRALANVAGDEASAMALSPDGTMVAYDLARNLGSGARDTHVLDVETGRTSPLIVAASNDLDPCWLPAGHTLAFSSDRDGTLGLWAVDVAAGHVVGQPRVLRKGMGRFHPLGFTAAGEFYFASESGTIDVYRVELGPNGTFTSSPTMLADTFVGRNLDADWSPDGQYVVLVSRRGEVTFDRGSMSVLLRRLSDGSERRFTPDVDGVHDPHWSPDGRRIVFGGRTGEVDRLYVLSVDSGEVRPLGVTGL